MRSPIDYALALPRTLLAVGLLAASVWLALHVDADFAKTHYTDVNHLRQTGGMHTSGVVFVVLWTVGGLAACACVLADGARWERRMRDIEQSKPTRYRRWKVEAVPEGDYVTIKLHQRGQDYAERRQFHAENDEERAHEYVAEFKARMRSKPEPTSTPEARALARTLAR